MFCLNDYLIHPENTPQTLKNNHWLQTCCPLISVKFCLCVGLSHPPLKLKAVIFTKRHQRWELSQLKIHINFSWPSQNIFTQNKDCGFVDWGSFLQLKSTEGTIPATKNPFNVHMGVKCTKRTFNWFWNSLNLILRALHAGEKIVYFCQVIVVILKAC